MPVSAPLMPTVLLVDDDAALLDAVKDTLKPLAVRVEMRESAEEALAWLQAGGDPTLIISNQWMVGMTGQALFRWVARHKPAVRCVLHTGDEAQRGDENVTVLIKPASAGILRNMVSAICGAA